jgi:hypothetical protein
LHHQDYDDSDDSADSTHSDSVQHEQPGNCANIEIAKYLMHLEVNGKMSALGVDMVLTNTLDFAQNCMDTVKMSLLHNPEIKSKITQREIEQCFDNHSVTSAGAILGTPFLRNEFYKKHCKLLPAQTILLGSGLKRKNNKLFRTKHFAHVVPFKESLEQLLNIPEIWHFYNNSHVSTDGMMRDVCDGRRLKNHPFTLQGKNFVQVIVSWDDVEIQNPLRSNANHKVAMIYFTLANIPPQYRSKLHNIFLLGIAKSKFISQEK